MYGFTPSADDREARQAAAREQVEQAEQGVALEELLRAAAWSTPGTGTWARNRKTIRIPRTKSSRRRMSGARNALSSDSNTELRVVAGVGAVGLRVDRRLTGASVRRVGDGVGRVGRLVDGSASSASASATSGARVGGGSTASLAAAASPARRAAVSASSAVGGLGVSTGSAASSAARPRRPRLPRRPSPLARGAPPRRPAPRGVGARGPASAFRLGGGPAGGRSRLARRPRAVVVDADRRAASRSGSRGR